jgi:hypothetical protein
MKRACSLLREPAHYAADSFSCGLRALGYTLTRNVSDLGPGDLLLTWNRHTQNNDYANEAAAHGATVVVSENGYFGRDWLGDTWFALALDHHNGAGRWPRDDGRRWRAIGFELEPARETGQGIVILPQRGIGEPGVAMPLGWAERVQAETGARIRPHPGRNAEDTLRADLANASAVITWGSGAAIKAIAWGYRCFHQFPKWIGATASAMLTPPMHAQFVFEGDRTPMFERLACAQWRVGEVESGYALDQVLNYSV